MESFLKRTANVLCAQALVDGLLCRPAFTEVFAVAIEKGRADNAETVDMLANAVQTSMHALAAYVYPTAVGASGVAYAAAIGRAGDQFVIWIGPYPARSNSYWPLPD
jgi:hypothetical protein